MILLPSQRSEHWSPRDLTCRYCSTELGRDEIGVLWVEEQDLLFHPTCARSLGVHLIADSREAELARGEHPWSRRAARAAGAAMKTAEGVRA